MSTNHTAALAALREQITTGWTVDITGGYLVDDREGARVEQGPNDTLIFRPRRPWSSQGRKFPTMTFTWDGDMEADGHTVRLYHTATGTTSRSWKGQRQVVRTFRFHPPR